MDGKPVVRPLLGRFLHTTGLTPDGDLAFAHCLKLALAARGDLCVVHTDPDKTRAGAEWDAFPGVRPTLAKWGLLDPEAPASAVRETLGMSVRKIDIPDREPVHGVLGLVEKHPVDLVVLASQAREGVDRWLHPSIAEPIARKTRLPTLFLPEGARGFVDPATGAASLRNILVPIDRQPRPDEALALAVALTELVGAGDAVFHMLHVGQGWPWTPVPEGHEGRFRQLQRGGGVVDEIVDLANDLDVELIVMPTHGHDGLLDALRGSTTEQVLRRAGRALLAVPAP